MKFDSALMCPLPSSFVHSRRTLFVVIFFIAAIHVGLNLSFEKSFQTSFVDRQENGARWNPGVFKMISLGQLPVAVDWTWIRVILDSRVSHVAKGTHPKVYYDLDLITDVDRLNFDAYKAGGHLLAVVRDDGPGARDILLKGDSFRTQELSGYPKAFRDEFWRMSWSLPLSLAYVYLFELQDLPRASVYYQAASDVPGSPPYLERISKRLQSGGGVYEVGLNILNLMITQGSGQARIELERKREFLLVAQYMYELNHSFLEYLKTHPESPAKGARIASQNESVLNHFFSQMHTSGQDPWGGQLSWDGHGRIVTTTAYERVFNLD